MNKKALQWTTLIGLVIGGVAILATFAVYAKWGNLLETDTSEQAEQLTFARLANEINTLSKMSGFNSKRDIPFKIGKDYVIMGFNANQEVISENCPPEEEVIKPESCGDKACLCFYKNSDETVLDMQVIEPCIILPDVDIIYSLDYSEYDASDIRKNFVGSKYENELLDANTQNAYFVVYGECDGWWWDVGTKSVNLYIEKSEKKGKNIVFIGYQD
ncbi:MAG: hypothetical protein ACOC1K_07075 [Nanoarchaeota archaeon]